MAKRKSNEQLPIPQMPFDDALKKIMSAPPKHQVGKKRANKKKGAKREK